MGLRQDGEAGKLSPETCSLGKPPARFARLMRSCFFGGAMNAVFLLQKGYDDQLASDIAGLHLGTAAVVKPKRLRTATWGCAARTPCGREIDVERTRIQLMCFSSSVADYRCVQDPVPPSANIRHPSPELASRREVLAAWLFRLPATKNLHPVRCRKLRPEF
jgi:hypothetical protein